MVIIIIINIQSVAVFPLNAYVHPIDKIKIYNNNNNNNNNLNL